MAVEFLTDEQAAGYGRFEGEPSQAELERFFLLAGSALMTCCGCSAGTAALPRWDASLRRPGRSCARFVVPPVPTTSDLSSAGGDQAP